MPINEAKTMGEAIQMARTIPDHLFVVENFVWLPTDENLQPHLRTQLIHHEKRRRWGSQLLDGLGQAALSSWENYPLETLSLLDGEGGKIWTDERLVRAIMSVAIPMGEEARAYRPEKEGVWIAAALKGLHVLSGCVAPVAPFESSLPEMQTWVDLHRGISILIQSADSLSGRTSLKDAIEARWAIRGLTARLQLANSVLSNIGASVEINDRSTLDFTTPTLNARISNLPFDIFPHCLPWQMNPSSPRNLYSGYQTGDLVPKFLHSIPFNFDTLTTRRGNSVIERRGTAWLAERGVGALAYSGKLMRPAAVPEVVSDVMRKMEQWCVNQGQRQPSRTITTYPNDSSSKALFEFKWDDRASALSYNELGQFLQPEYQQDHIILPTFFDCALCNHYPDGDSACKFHTDPEHGSHWHRTTAVVSCGSSRIFSFRPMPKVSIWSEWDDVEKKASVKEKKQNENTPVVFNCSPVMWCS